MTTRRFKGSDGWWAIATFIPLSEALFPRRGYFRVTSIGMGPTLAAAADSGGVVERYGASAIGRRGGTSRGSKRDRQGKRENETCKGDDEERLIVGSQLSPKMSESEYHGRESLEDFRCDNKDGK
ncbi:hypothetical protein Pmani_020422 [Petrolisthes manimaculis]|uniref:Uncharacterized protein n=1 Tax=Petrolisthes manimaculis TaxID=1843537 RepID=A0AAE1PGV9_9EUCA|nr:hypothetical protein Pmani_020422 [Petrolisthes manimaculis]